MTPDAAWRQLKLLENVEFRRWTSAGAVGRPFAFRLLRASGGLESIHFYRGGRDVKSASRDRFVQFFEMWTLGVQDPEAFRNEGKQRTKADVIHFLLPLFHAVSVGSTASGDSQEDLGGAA